MRRGWFQVTGNYARQKTQYLAHGNQIFYRRYGLVMFPEINYVAHWIWSNIKVPMTPIFCFGIFWLVAVFKIRNNPPKRPASSPWPFFRALKVRFGGQKVFLLSAAKTIMLCSCDVENCDDTSATMAEKGKNSKNRRTYCLAGAPTDVSYKNNTHIPVFLCTIVQRM